MAGNDGKQFLNVVLVADVDADLRLSMLALPGVR
jgi:hypothetical protein